MEWWNGILEWWNGILEWNTGIAGCCQELVEFILWNTGITFDLITIKMTRS